MDNIRKNERNLLNRNQQREGIIKNNHLNNEPKHVGKVRDFDMNLYDKGRNWQKNGLPLSGASDQLKGNIAFVRGYNRENQLSKIVGNRKER